MGCQGLLWVGGKPQLVDIRGKKARLGKTVLIQEEWMEEIRFEQALEELRNIVQTLERGEKPLEEALALFERGIALVSTCTRRLDEVEKRVEMLLRNQAGELQVCPFEEPSQSGG